MAHRLNWSPGHEGKGNYYANGDISTWNIDEIGGPHHDETAARESVEYPAFRFYISPEGGIHDGGIGFTNQTAMTDDQVLGTIEAQDPHLFDDSSNPNVTMDFDTTPRVQAPGGGYGHAYNLLNMASVDKSEWPDCHAELKIPRNVRHEIRRWVDRLKWPEGSTKDDARTYHITILSVDEYDEDFVRWMKMRIAGRSFRFKSVGMDLFGPNNDVVVLRLECPAWRALAIEWGEEAEARDLSPRRFAGGPRAHITVGKTDGSWPQGVPDPHIEFDTATFNINKNSAITWVTGDGICDRCGDPQIGKDSEDGEATCSNCGSSIVVKTNGWQSATQPTLADELKQWLDSFGTQPALSPSLHHDNPEQMQPQTSVPASTGPFVDPPSHPYQPYNWADEIPEYSYLSKIACFECGIDHPGDEPCPLPDASQHREMSAEWYNQAWHEPGSPKPWPDQPEHYRHDHAPSVEQA